MQRSRLAVAAVAMLFLANLASAHAAGESFVDRPELPESPAGVRTREFLELINTGDEAALKRFVDQTLAPSFKGNAPPDEFLSFLRMIRQAHGQFQFKASRSYEKSPQPGAVVAITRTVRSDRWLGVSIGVEPVEPHRITSLVISDARPPENLVDKSSLTSAQLAAEMERYLRSLVEKDAFSGSVLIAVGDEVVYAGAFGEADREKHVPNTLDTRFGLSSMGKMFTAIAIAQLAEAGKLKFDDTLSKYLDKDWLPGDPSGSLTIRHLLSHTGGTGDFLKSLSEDKNRGKYLQVSDYKQLVAGQPLAFVPGTRFQYSNSGFILLGAVIEKLTGMRYEDYLRTSIWGPAGMTGTACLRRDRPVPARAIGYYEDIENGTTQWKSNASLVAPKGSPAGGCDSSVSDLHKFAVALRAGKLVKPGTLEEMWKEQSVSNPVMRYGLGFVLGGTDSDRVVGHGGSFPGAYGEFDLLLDRQATVIVLSNGHGAGSAHSKARELLTRLGPSRENPAPGSH
jgi:CubicO group peptidase (beta-lactamase class C family)